MWNGRALAAALPHLKIAYAHLDGREKQIVLIQKHENACYDFSAYGANHEGLLRHVINHVSADRILFGIIQLILQYLSLRRL